MEEKTAIVMAGGGVAAAYGAGVLKALSERLPSFKPDFAIGGSGSAGSLAYYLSGQPDMLRQIWVDFISSRRFVNPWRFWKMMDIDYLIDEVVRRQVPLDVEALKASKTKFLIPVTDVSDGGLTYLSNHGSYDVYEILRAAKSIVMFYNRTVKLGSFTFVDSPLAASLVPSIQKAVSMGATKLIAVENTHIYTGRDLTFRIWMTFRNTRLRKNYIRQRKLFRSMPLTGGAQILFIKPRPRLCSSPMNNTKLSIANNFDRGYDDLMRDKEIETFLAKRIALVD